MNWKTSICSVTLTSLTILINADCTESAESVAITEREQTTRPGEGTGKTHSHKVVPYDEIGFPADQVNQIKITINEAFSPEILENKYQEIAGMITLYAAQEFGEAPFELSGDGLINRFYERYQAAVAFLAGEGGK